jgi:hypothetical protein
VAITWLFLILILSSLAVACVAMAIYLRISHHMKNPQTSPGEITNDAENEGETSKL